MINYHTTLIAALRTVLPTYYEMTLHSGIKTPCISYMERSNNADINGDTIGYSRISYQVKVWGDNLEELQMYSQQIDAVLRPLGWKRINCGELYDNSSSMIQKILTFEAYAIEEFIGGN